MLNSNRDLFQKKKIIRFKTLLHLYHHPDDYKLNAIAIEVETNKSDITKCVNLLAEEGLVEKTGYRDIQLTDKGKYIASSYHRKYEMAHNSLKQRFDPEAAQWYAESLAMQFDEDEIVKIFSIGAYAKKLTDKLSSYQVLDGSKFCELIDNGSFAVQFTIDPIFNPMSHMHAQPDTVTVEKELAEFWRNRSKDNPERKKRRSDADKSEAFEEFLGVLIKKIQSIFFKRYLSYKETKSISMANQAFLHPAFCQIENKKGCLRLHRIVITERGMRGTILTCKASVVRYYDGNEFVDCPFDGDDVQIPLDHFKFTRYGDCLIGKQIMQFKAECDEADMPISVAEIVVVFYPI